MKSLLTPICIILLCFGFQVQAQEETPEEPIDILLERLDKFQRLQPQEKLYLHLEKEVHDQGEHLWFKIYLVAGALHRPSPISTGAYIEMISPEGQSLFKKYIKINRGLGYGDIEITDEMPAGTYRLRTYTRWMKNFDWDFIPETKVVIKEAQATASPQANCDVSFVPEGGKWIAGLPQKLAFYNASGRLVSGSIADSKGNELTKFSSSENGVGTVEMEVEAGAQLFARIEGCEATVKLPKVEESGTVMTARKMGQQFIRLDIATNQEEDGSLLYAVIQSRGVVANRLQIQISGGRARAVIPVKDLPSGIAQISLFNEQVALLSERLVYVDADHELEAAHKMIVKERSDRQEVELTLKNEDDQAIFGHFSVALFANEKPVAQRSIGPYLSLSAELPLVNNVNAFFDDETGKAKPSLDPLLMTQKWQWITWKTLILNRLTATDKSLNTYMNDAYIERQKFKEDEEAIDNLDPNARRLDDVVVTAKREEVEENTAVPNIYGRGDGGTIDMDKIQANDNETFLDMLRGRIAGVRVHGLGQLATINIRNTVTGSGDSTFVPLEPLIMLDNIPTDLQSVMNLQNRFIKSIDIFKGSQAAIFGMRGAGGAIVIYTRNTPVMNAGAREQFQDEEEEEEVDSEPELPYERANEFEPRSLNEDQGLIFWSPVLTTDEKGHLTFTYKKPENASAEVYMHLQGMGRDGKTYTLIKKLK